MDDGAKKKLQYFVLICNPKKQDTYTALLKEHGARGVSAVYGHGSAAVGTLARAFGFEGVQGKILITCLLPNENAAEMIEILYREYNFDKPNTGIAYCVSVEGLMF